MKYLLFAALLWPASAFTGVLTTPQTESTSESAPSTSSTAASLGAWTFPPESSRVYAGTGTVDIEVDLSDEVTKVELHMQDATSDSSIVLSSASPRTGDAVVQGDIARRQDAPLELFFSINGASPSYTISLDLTHVTERHGVPHFYFFRAVAQDNSENSPGFGINLSANNFTGFSTEQANMMRVDDPVPLSTTTGDAPSDNSQATTTSEDGDSQPSLGSGISAEDSDDGKGGGGLAKGAIAGIAIGAFVAVVLILGLIWFFLRRRKQANKNMSVHPDASTPLAGYPNATAGRSGEFMGEKDAGAMAIAESPRSQMYTDQPSHNRSSQGGALGTAAVGGTGPATGGYTDSGHQAYDAASSPPPARSDHATPPPPRDESSRTGMNSPVPSTTVARHLVDPDMTEDDIRRLEEEERELDRQIQEAGRRK